MPLPTLSGRYENHAGTFLKHRPGPAIQKLCDLIGPIDERGRRGTPTKPIRPQRMVRMAFQLEKRLALPYGQFPFIQSKRKILSQKKTRIIFRAALRFAQTELLRASLSLRSLRSDP